MGKSDWDAGATLYAQSRPSRKVPLNQNSEWEEGASLGKIQGGRFIQARGDICIFLGKKKSLFILFWQHQVLVATLRIFIEACRIFLVVACKVLTCDMHLQSSSPTRDRTQASCIGSMESYPLDHQGSPEIFVFLQTHGRASGNHQEH